MRLGCGNLLKTDLQVRTILDFVLLSLWLTCLLAARLKLSLKLFLLRIIS